jgi:hypothetical protein
MPKKKQSNPIGRPRKYETVDSMSEAIEAYFRKCDGRVVKEVVTQSGKKVLVDVPKPEPYTIQGIAVWLDLTTEGLREYQMREEFSVTIKKAKQRIEANKVVHMLDGDGSTTGYIFDLKNNHGWKDKRDIAVGGPVKLKVVYGEDADNQAQGTSQETT